MSSGGATVMWLQLRFGFVEWGGGRGGVRVSGLSVGRSHHQIKKQQVETELSMHSSLRGSPPRIFYSVVFGFPILFLNELTRSRPR